MERIWSPWRMEYISNNNPDEACVFCSEPTRPDNEENLIVHRGQKVYVILNRYPYTSGHLLVVPYDHQPSLELLEPATRVEMMELATRAIEILRQQYAPQGFNVGINIGEAAGAGIAAHVHLHIVPRWRGDTNFMSSLGQTRVMPENLSDTYHRLTQGWP